MLNKFYLAVGLIKALMLSVRTDACASASLNLRSLRRPYGRLTYLNIFLTRRFAKPKPRLLEESMRHLFIPRIT